MKKKPLPPGTKQILFTFDEFGSSHPHTRVAGVQTSMMMPAYFPFLPLGVLIWGATADTYLLSVRVGNQHEATATGARIPARYFSTGKSLAEVCALAEVGELSLSLPDRQMLEMKVAEVGVHVGVHVEGPFEDVCLWGLTYAYGGPTTSVVIEKAEFAPSELDARRGATVSLGYRGQVVEHRLGGDTVTCDVRAPSEESVCRLLAALHRPSHG